MIISIADLVIRDRFDGKRSIGLLAGSPGMFIHYMRGDCDADRRRFLEGLVRGEGWCGDLSVVDFCTATEKIGYGAVPD